MSSSPPHLEALYALFARYPLRVSAYCDHCWSFDEVLSLKQSGLHDRRFLDGVLSSLLSTLGDANDVKHLIPRLLEAYDAHCVFQRELIARLLRQVGLTAKEELGLKAFFTEEAMYRFLSPEPAPVLEPAALYWLQPRLEAELARAVNSPRWYAQLIIEIGSRHAQRPGIAFDAYEQPLVDWVFASARPELLERSFFGSPQLEDQRFFSLALQTLEFWL
ncbi:MAG: hypothetical protein QM817_36710 [Archangium sp.]